MRSDTLIPVDTVPTPNPDAIMLKVMETLIPSGTHEFKLGDDTESSPLATALFTIDGIELVLIAPRFVTLRKRSDIEWPDVVPMAKDSMRDFLQSGQMAVVEEAKSIAPEQLGAIEHKRHVHDIVCIPIFDGGVFKGCILALGSKQVCHVLDCRNVPAANGSVQILGGGSVRTPFADACPQLYRS